MSVGEVAWRMRCLSRDVGDRCLARRRRRARPRGAVVRGGAAEEPGFRVCDLAVGQWASPAAAQQETAWRQRLEERAEKIAAGRLSFLGLEDQPLGDPIDWQRDHESGRGAPLRFSPSIDYRDAEAVGDCKYVWEPNRHHQLVVLARAYRAGGDLRFARAAVRQLADWLGQNPYGLGMNWRSPLELGVRLINWVWAADLLRDSRLIEGPLREQLLDSAGRHVWEIDRKYSQGSSANNHLIGEAAGAFVASCYFSFLKGASRWRERSRQVLLEQLFEQSYADGGTREQAMGYHLFDLQFFLIAGLVARWRGEEFPQEYWQRLERMFEFVGAFNEGGGLPMFGDWDEGYVLDLGGAAGDVRPWMSVAAALYGRADFKAWAGRYAEPARWLLGRSSRERFDAIPAAAEDRIVSRAFPQSGRYLLQSGSRTGPDRISVAFDCGAHGFLSIACHAHADALSFVLRAFGMDVLVDPGTYDYFSHPRWRDYFRSTRAHNTVVIDGQDQSVMEGPFLWGRRAEARCLAWQPSPTGGLVLGEHDGYARLKDPALHRRALELDGQQRKLTVRDEILARGRHRVEVCFHVAEHCGVTPLGSNRYSLDVGANTATMELDEKLQVELLKGGEDPIGGWVSRGYHRKLPAWMLVGRCSTEGEARLTCRIDLARPGEAAR